MSANESDAPSPVDRVLREMRSLRAQERKLAEDMARIELASDLLCVQARRLGIDADEVQAATGWDKELVDIRLRDYPEEEDQQLYRLRRAGITV